MIMQCSYLEIVKYLISSLMDPISDDNFVSYYGQFYYCIIIILNNTIIKLIKLFVYLIK